MFTKSQCINLFNNMIRGTPVSFEEMLLPIISEYLTEINLEKSQKMINLIVQNPNLAQNLMPKLVEHYCRKFNIFSIIFNNQTILYYE